jgi:hypothetical protein
MNLFYPTFPGFRIVARSGSSVRASVACCDGSLQPIIDRAFALTEIAEAQAYLEADKHVGKVVIRV